MRIVIYTVIERIYQYRYTGILGKRQIIYTSDLKELREKNMISMGMYSC